MCKRDAERTRSSAREPGISGELAHDRFLSQAVPVRLCRVLQRLVRFVTVILSVIAMEVKDR
jgi:hypothetical protein